VDITVRFYNAKDIYVIEVWVYISKTLVSRTTRTVSKHHFGLIRQRMIDLGAAAIEHREDYNFQDLTLDIRPLLSVNLED
jgi:hypothetical protein